MLGANPTHVVAADIFAELVFIYLFFDKLLENLTAVRLYWFLYVHNIRYDYQFGFRKNHSTTLALIDVHCVSKKSSPLGLSW